MKTMSFFQKAGGDRVLHLDIPVDAPNAVYEVVVVLQNQAAATTAEVSQTAWPPGFVEQTAGSIADETFIRHPQGEYEKRLDWE